MRRLLPLLVVVSVGCDADSSPPDHPPPTPPAAVTSFDPAGCGTVGGRVTWSGARPKPEEFLFGVPKPDRSGFDIRMMPNPNAPAIDATTGAVAGAVVFLRGVNPAAAKPWDLPPVRVEMADRQVVVRQGDGAASRAGFVRRGDAVTMTSRDPFFHVLRGRGAAFFSLTFPDPECASSRPFETPGRVELSSGAGFYWASADLFVADHPYYTLTDRDGRFTLTRVPEGAVELVVWMPGWAAARHDRDPESGLITRMSYAAPIERTRPVTTERGRLAEVAVAVAE